MVGYDHKCFGSVPHIQLDLSGPDPPLGPEDTQVDDDSDDSE